MSAQSTLFSTNNILVGLEGDVTGVVDFNIAGDEALINDMVTERIFLCHMMDLDEGVTGGDRGALLDQFINRYMQVRPLSILEISVMNDTYSVVFTFLWTRVEHFENCLEASLVEDANAFLYKTWDMLEDRSFGYRI